MIRTDYVIMGKRVGDKFLRTFNYFQDDGVTPDNPTSFSVKVQRPDGTTDDYSTSPEVIIAGDDHIISIALAAIGDTFIEVRATWANDAQSTMFYIYASEAL